MSSGARAGPALFDGPGEMAARVRELDWSVTAVGPRSGWPASLVTAVEIMLRSQFPMFLAWGRELTMFYNDAYVPVLGGKHPAALGAPTEQVWREIWDVLGPLAADVLDGRANYAEDLLLVMARAGFEEETYFTFSYSPIPAEPVPDGVVADGVVAGGGRGAGGLFCACTETTRRVVGERRLVLLSALGELSTTDAESVAAACAAAVRVLESNRADVPYAVVYLCEPGGASARLVASYGVRIGRGVAPPTLPDPGSGVSIWRAATTGQPQVSTGLATRYPQLILPVPGAVGDAVHDTAVVVPLRVGAAEHPVGVLVVGVSPYRPLDGDYRAFVDLVAGHVESVIDDARAYDAERRRAEALAELDRAKTEFFANISHEFRTPLTLMMGPVEELRVTAEGADRARLDMVARNGLRLGRLVNNLLEFSRIQAGHTPSDYQRLDLAVLTADLAAVFRAATDRAGLDLVVDCPPLPAPVWADRDMWEKVVLNLVSNAVKYTRAGTITVILRPAQASHDDISDSSRGGAGVVLTVFDTGIGVPAHELPRLFDRFHRVPDTRARSIEGSGIGLALTRQLVEAHGGTITATSTLDVGTAFTVTMPAVIMPAEPVTSLPSGGDRSPAEITATSGLAESFAAETWGWLNLEPAPSLARDHRGVAAAVADAAVADAAGAAAGREWDGGRVLVVDDNADMRAYLTRLLAPVYRVDAAGDGAAALAAARTDPPDLVITDVMMPGLDGFGLLAALRADPATATVPVIVVSARAGEEAAGQGLAAGADDYLVKPFSAADLLARVRSTLALARLRSHDGAWRTAVINALRDAFFVIDATGAVVEINDAFHGMFGYGPDGLPYATPHPWWPDPAADPDGFAQVADALGAVQQDGRGRYRLPLRHRDGRRVWAECSADSVPDRDGTGRVIIGVARDVTAARFGEQRDRLLAETGRLLTQPAELVARLTALCGAAAPVLADLAVVSLAGPDGRFTPVAAAHRDDPAIARAVLALAPHIIPDKLRPDYLAGSAFVLGEIPTDLLAEASADPQDLAARQHLTGRSSLLAPLVVAGRLLGSLTFVSTRTVREHDDAEVALAEEMGRRVAGVVEAERVAVREQQLHASTAALSAAGTLEEAAAALSTALVDALGAAGTAVYAVGPDDPHLRLLHTTGYPPEVAASFGRIRADADLPAAEAARTRAAVWLGDQQGWLERYPQMAVPGAAETALAIAALPLIVAERVVGVAAASFPTGRAFPADERGFAMTLAGQAAAAFDRAATSDAHWRIAQTLQRNLLPARLPTHPRLALAARYLPAGRYTQAGGDWYDVIVLDEDRVAVVVGDVVGNGAGAAAVMAQLRSALAGFLLESHAPAHAIGWLSRLAARIDGARGSTAICVVLHTGTGELRWARAGHPPPLLIDPPTPDGSAGLAGGVRYLDDARGVVLGFPDAFPITEGHIVLAPGASVLLYTDGLVERRGEVIDDGLDRLAGAASHRNVAPEDLVAAMLAAGLDDTAPTDDVAVLAARLLPGPLRQRIPAVPAQLPVLRRTVAAWTAAAGLPEMLVEDLQLALGEAAANAIEHAYPADAPGELAYQLDLAAAGGVHVEVRDDGVWRPPPADPGYRGRGLALIDALASDGVSLDTTTGTSVRFTLAVAAADTSPPGTSPSAPPSTTATPGRTGQASGAVPLAAGRDPAAAVVLHLGGDLDLATIGALRAGLLDQVRATPSEIILDTRDVSYLSSAGVGLLMEAVQIAPDRIRVDVRPGSPVARILALAGLHHPHAALPRPAPPSTRS